MWMLQLYLEEVRGSEDKGQIPQPPCINSVPFRPIDTPLSVKAISPFPTPPFLLTSLPPFPSFQPPLFFLFPTLYFSPIKLF